MAQKKSKTESVLPGNAELMQFHQESIQGTLDHWASMKEVPQSLLITGPKGIGKRTFVYHLAQWWMCENGPFSESPKPGQIQSCNQCATCKRALSGQAFDFLEVSSEADLGTGESNQIKIEQLRQIKETLGHGAFGSRYRVIFIRDCERLTAQAANSLLKMLEEPPPGWIFVMTASDPSLVLPTLVSRCQLLRLRPLPDSILKKILIERDVAIERISTILTLSHGSLGLALSLSNPDFWNYRQLIMRFIENPQAEYSALVDWASSEPGHFQFLLNQLEAISAEKLNLPNLSDSARQFWIQRFTRLSEARQESLVPVNRKILIQDILLSWVYP